MRSSHHFSLVLLLLLSLTWTNTCAVVNVPGVEYNAATGESAYASSYYDYPPNIVRDTKFLPQNAIDGFTDESSWWSSGEENATALGAIFWQLNLTIAPPTLKRIVVRWYGFLTPTNYRIRVSLMGTNFQTIAVIVNRTIQYDRVDTITANLDKVDPRFRFLRVVIESPNICADTYSCAADGGAAALHKTNERAIYGIREFELWVTGNKNAASIKEMTLWRWLVPLLLVMQWSDERVS